MIRQFDSIQNLGVFSSYKKPKEISKFERYNLIYGLNGSGKTTLSRFFDDLNSGKADGFPDLKFRITTDEGVFTQGNAYARKLRVFNSEYVNKNIGEIEGTLNPIFIIGEENKTLAEQVRSDEQLLDELTMTMEAAKAEKAGAEKKLDKTFSQIAKEIGKIQTGSTTRTYRKPEAERAFSKLSQKQSLDTASLAKIEAAIKQQPMSRIDTVAIHLLGEAGSAPGDSISETVRALESEVIDVLALSAKSIALSELDQNPKLANWLETGVEIHKQSDPDQCKFCGQKMPTARFDQLLNYFNKSDQELKEKIQRVAAKLSDFRRAILQLGLPSELVFYVQFRDQYREKLGDFREIEKTVCAHIDLLLESLEEKQTRRTESYHGSFDRFEAQSVDTALANLNRVVELHNEFTENFEAKSSEQLTKIENHFLSSIFDDVIELRDQISNLTASIEALETGTNTPTEIGISALRTRIETNRASVSNSHKAAATLSANLQMFLGRSELKFESEGEGYRIMRSGRAATRLSEGERTAIAFLHFVVGLRDQEFEISDGIVVIDDPISSLDSSSVYQAFSFLKNAVKDAHQVFLLTHNFEFLKLLLNWFQHLGKNASYWMLHCTSEDGFTRRSELKPLDAVLRNNKNEYTYLFKVLYQFKSDGTVANSYHIPNVARKVLEVFLDQHSTGDNMYKQLNNLDFDENKKTALYKYANDLSHPTMSGIDPALVGETQTNVGHVFDMISEVAPAHYQAMIKVASEA